MGMTIRYILKIDIYGREIDLIITRVKAKYFRG